VEFSGNTSESLGGAINAHELLTITRNESVVFDGNIAESTRGHDTFGGAIYTFSSYADESLSISENESIVFSNNKAGTKGGAIYSNDFSTISNNKLVEFSSNTAGERGGAFHAYDKTYIRENAEVNFSSNSAGANGGAIYNVIELNLTGNDQINFIDNSAKESGGAILANDVLNISGNKLVNFSGNSATTEGGGAICGYYDHFIDRLTDAHAINISGNEEVIFKENKAINPGAYGGAIATWVGIVTLADNKSLTFSGNSAKAYAGAIFAEDGIVIANNEYVLFEKNVLNGSNGLMLKGLYLDPQSNNKAIISAPEDGLVEFRDSMEINAGGALDLNMDYQTESGSILKQTGDILLNGLYAEKHLQEIKGAKQVTRKEVVNSRTSIVHGTTKLHGGRLRVENAAVLQGEGLTAMANSGATVRLKYGALDHKEHDITFQRGTTLELAGNNQVFSKTLVMESNSALTFYVGNDHTETPVLTYTGSFQVGGALTLNVKLQDSVLNVGNYKLITLIDSGIPTNWTAQVVTVDSEFCRYADLVWKGKTLYLVNNSRVTDGNEDFPGGDIQPDGPGAPEIPDEEEKPVVPDEPEGLTDYTPQGTTLAEGTVNKNQNVILNGKGSITLEGEVEPGALTVDIVKNLTLKSNRKNPGTIIGLGNLTKTGKGTLTMNDNNRDWRGDTILKEGTIKLKGAASLGQGNVFVQGGTLNLSSKAIENDIFQAADAVIKGGKKFVGTYTLESGSLLKGSHLNINETATLESGTINGKLSGTGEVQVLGDVYADTKASIVTKRLLLTDDAVLSTSTKGLKTDSKATRLIVEDGSKLVLGGKLTTRSMVINNGTLVSDSIKPVSISMKSSMALKDSTASIYGKTSVGSLYLENSNMTMSGEKAQNLTVKEALSIGSGSSLTLKGKLSTGNLEIGNVGRLSISGTKPATIKVKDTLTLNVGSSIILQDFNFKANKTYKILTFKRANLKNVDLYNVFGVSQDDCVITNTGKAITLTVTGNWNPVGSKAVATAAAEPMAIATEDKQADEPVIKLTAPVASAAAAAETPATDALVQANWGQLEASRAFVGAITGRSMAVQLEDGERAVWASAIGGTSRHDSAHGHNGADTNISGGAFGLETQVGRASIFGMALGNSWTRVSAHNFGTIKQDTTHLGLYGQTNWRNNVSADWSAVYGRSESETKGIDWNQKHLQLDGRVSYSHELNANTVLRGFGGMQYYASDSARIDSSDTGSLQNLRAEIGVGASHNVGKLGLYGEIALHQDIARNNPTVDTDADRFRGMNPGRTGVNFTVGASYELNDKWSVNASYTGEVVENANAHNASVGASYKF
ncbi:MAG: autotransporter domain-containing protein, partial [Akkermansia sp.]|nr:autotransporter domain-containing protein [Akkermansia sp.]